MRNLDLTNHRRARVWIEELPDATYRSSKTLAHTILGGTALPSRPTRAAVELFVPLGGRFMYGLLGGQRETGPLGQFSVEVNTSSSSDKVLADSLAKNVDEVFIGLPLEYAQAVFDGVELAKKESGAVTPGKLLISCAAYGSIGSNETVFRHLAAILIRVFNTAGIAPTDEDLIKLFPLTFT